MFKKIRICLGLFFYVALRSEIVVMLLLSKPSKAPSKTEKARVQLTKDLTFPWEGSAHSLEFRQRQGCFQSVFCLLPQKSKKKKKTFRL